MEPGSRITLVCRSRGTSQFTRLMWYSGDEVVDSSYSIVGDFVTNEFMVDMSENLDKTLECRLEFEPTDLRISEIAVIEVAGTCVRKDSSSLAD